MWKVSTHFQLMYRCHIFFAWPFLGFKSGLIPPLRQQHSSNNNLCPPTSDHRQSTQKKNLYCFHWGIGKIVWDKEKEGENERKTCKFFPYWDWGILQAIITIAKSIWAYLAGREKQTLQTVEKKKCLSHIYEDWYLTFETSNTNLACGLHQVQAETAAFHLTSFL